MDDASVDPTRAVAMLDARANGVFRLPPNLAVALVLPLLFWIAAGLFAHRVQQVGERRDVRVERLHDTAGRLRSVASSPGS